MSLGTKKKKCACFIDKIPIRFPISTQLSEIWFIDFELWYRLLIYYYIILMVNNHKSLLNKITNNEGLNYHHSLRNDNNIHIVLWFRVISSATKPLNSVCSWGIKMWIRLLHRGVSTASCSGVAENTRNRIR